MLIRQLVDSWRIVTGGKRHQSDRCLRKLHPSPPPILPPVSSHSAPVAEPTQPSEGVPHTPVAVPLPQRENTVLTPIAEQDPPSPPVMTPLKSVTPKREQPPPEPTPPSTFRTSRRSGRTIRPPQRYVQDANLASLAPSYQPNDLLSMMKASISDPDTLSYDEAMRDNDIDRWKEAAENEIRELEGRRKCRNPRQLQESYLEHGSSKESALQMARYENTKLGTVYEETYRRTKKKITLLLCQLEHNSNSTCP